jgi:hypothetical protein
MKVVASFFLLTTVPFKEKGTRLHQCQMHAIDGRAIG